MDRELVEKFIEVTGESEATAHQYLALADGNVEMAISLMFEGGRPSEASTEPLPAEPEPEVRPPILPTQEILVPSDPVCSFPRFSNNVFDRFRDFAVETQRQEEEMSRRVGGVRQISQRKSKRLEDLFRPPSNILFLGSFLEAREYAKSLNHWLLVNVQNPQEFSCQVLNRDVWPNQQIQEIIKDHFVLWQVLSSTSEGKRYIDFYNVAEYPYLAIIDPRTGECMQTYNHITVDTLMSSLNDMLSTHPSPECSLDTPEERLNNHSMTLKRKSPLESMANECSSSVTECVRLPNRVDSIENTDMSSGRKNDSSHLPSSDIQSKKRRLDESEPEVETNQEQQEEQDNATKKESEPSSSKSYDDEAPFVRLCLRLPNGAKETVLMNSMKTIDDFLQKMVEMGFPPAEHTFLVPFPKTNVGALSQNIRLLDTILFPSNTIFISKK